MNKNEDSPLLTQYRRIKRRHSTEILFFRLGDFYEMFAEDALEVSALLNLTLTSRNGLPMCGVPYHSGRSYIARLLRYGKKVAVCEQIGSPQKGRSIIDRGVVEVITPGTATDEDFLEKGDSNYLASLCAMGGKLAFSYIDLSTGEFEADSFDYKDAASYVRGELERLQIKELIVQESLMKEIEGLERALTSRNGIAVNRWMDWLFDGGKGFGLLKKQFGTENLKGFGLSEDAPEISAAGALLEYLEDTARSVLPHIRRIKVRRKHEFVGIDESSLKNLELLHNLTDGSVRFSLLETLDETKTAMGRRLLKHRIVHPLRNVKKILARQDIVDFFYHNQALLCDFRGVLSKMPDFERQCSRLAMGRSHGKDIFSLKIALIQFEYAQNLLLTHGFRGIYEDEEASSLDGEAAAKLAGLKELLDRSIREDASVLLTEAGIIKKGFNAELDRLCELQSNSRGFLEEYLEEERLQTGISNLKIRYNRLIGYFFEINNANLSKTPKHFIKRQGLAGAERFTTDRLARLESDINNAQDTIISLEREIFIEVRSKAEAIVESISAAAHRIAELDAAQSLAQAAVVHGWTRPVVDEENRLNIVEGRHPVVETNIPRGEFIPNDTLLDAGASGSVCFALITGPNMAGKSTYLRQNALIMIMAQIGSFVPARRAEVGTADRIYCRVGASDNLARGESTFLSEMNETAYILNTASSKSLVIMDEVGRGTGTLDGLSIAQAVCETLLDRIACRTLFATHYHELASLENRRLAIRSMQVDEVDGQVVFRRRLVEGPSLESYGIHVARIAGLDEAVIERAKEIMEQLKSNTNKTRETACKKSVKAPKLKPPAITPLLFENI